MRRGARTSSSSRAPTSTAPRAGRGGRAGITPKEYVDPIAGVFRQLASDLGATNDFFIRTTDPEHKAFVQRFLERLRDHGDVYEGTYAGLYCDACEAFYRENELVDGKCPDHGTGAGSRRSATGSSGCRPTPTRCSRTTTPSRFVVPRARYNEARSFIEAGLDDVSLSRASVKWGVPLPWDPEQTIYVWFDALLNYTSALTYARPGEDLTARYWPARWQLLAKDILRFHAVIWPAMLISARLRAAAAAAHPRDAAGPDGKMSKTSGNVVDPSAFERYGLDALRYYLLREVAFGRDGGVGYAAARALPRRPRQRPRQPRHRSVAMIVRYRDGAVPAVPTAPSRALSTEVAGGFAGTSTRSSSRGRSSPRGSRARAQPLRRGAGAVEAGQGETPSVAELDDVLATLADGVRVVGVLLAVPARAAPQHAGGGGRGGDTSASPRRPAAVRPTVDTAVGPLFPRVDKPFGVIDAHTHLRASRAARRGLERAAAAGVGADRLHRRLAGAGRGGVARARARRRLATAGLHPHHAAEWSEDVRARSPRGRRPAVRGDRGDRARLVPRPGAARGAGAAFAVSSSWPRRRSCS